MDKNIEKLQAATALVAFDNTLRGVANTVVYYGVVFAVIGIIFTIRYGVVSSWLALAIGAALLVESFYIRRTRSARALFVSGMTFAVFAARFLGSFAVGLAKNDSSLGKGVIAGAFLTIGAWNILRSYSAYKHLLEIADPAVNQYVRDTLERMRTTTLSEHPQIVEFKKRGIGEKGTWRLQRDGDLLLVCRFADKTFGMGGRPQEAVYVPLHNVQIQLEGDRWLGKDLNANLSVGGADNKIQIKPEMLARLESMLTGAAGAATSAS